MQLLHGIFVSVQILRGFCKRKMEAQAVKIEFQAQQQVKVEPEGEESQPLPQIPELGGVLKREVPDLTGLVYGPIPFKRELPEEGEEEEAAPGPRPISVKLEPPEEGGEEEEGPEPRAVSITPPPMSLEEMLAVCMILPASSWAGLSPTSSLDVRPALS